MSEPNFPGGLPPSEPPRVVLPDFSSDPPHAVPPRKASSATKVLLFFLGGFALMSMICCGACCGFGFWADRTDHREMAQQIVAEYGQHPIVVEQLGGIDRCEGNLLAELDDREHDMIFDVDGPRGSGQILIDSIFGQIVTVILSKDGREWELSEPDMSRDETPADQRR